MLRVYRYLSAITLITALSAGASSFRAELLSVISDLQALSTGTFSEEEWNTQIDRLDRVYDEALAAGDTDMAVRARVVKARTLSEMRGLHDEALAVLAGVDGDLGDAPLPEAYRGVFLERAAICGRTGDEDAVARVMREYRDSALYDPTQYPILGGSGPGDPIIMVRPGAAGPESATEAAMRLQKKRAASTAGELFPDFEVTDADGTVRTLAGYQGKLLLVDVWIESWSSWERSLPMLKQYASDYGGRGFEVLGICLARGDAATSRAFVGKHRIAWPQVYGETDLPAALGLVGTVGNFLVGPDGRILARDVYGPELGEQLREHLGD